MPSGNDNKKGLYPVKYKFKGFNNWKTSKNKLLLFSDINPLNILKQAVSKRIYKNVSPYDGYDIKLFLKNVIKGRPNVNTRENHAYDLNTERNEIYKEMVESNTNDYSPEQLRKLKKINASDELFASYLGIPINERRSPFRFIKNGYNNLTKLPLDKEEWEDIIELTNNQDYNTNITSNYLFPYGLNISSFGKGYDKKGEYRSYGDRFDLNPFHGSLGKENVEKYPLLGKYLNKLGDASFGLFNPIDVYDRLYLDDFYEVPDKYRGGYYLLPKVIVNGYDHSHRGETPRFIPSLKKPSNNKNFITKTIDLIKLNSGITDDSPKYYYLFKQGGKIN